jgi:adhesin HecA-like repeat protein
LEIRDSTVQGNFAGSGGAIYNTGTLHLSTTTVTRNNTDDLGGGVYSRGTFEAEDSQFTNNGAFYVEEGGAVYNAENSVAVFKNCNFYSNGAGYNGGAIASYGTLQIEASKLLQNGSLDRGGAIFSRGSTTIHDSTLDENDTWNYAGTIDTSGFTEITGSVISNSYSWSGGTIISGGVIQIRNSTISNNLGDYEAAALLNYGRATIDYTTMADNFTNEPDAGGAILNYGTVEIKHSIIARTHGSQSCIGPITSTGPNLADDSSCAGFTVADPWLGPLQDNGGPTLTQALIHGSPAIDAAHDQACPATDQRGVARPVGAGCDLGAYEYDLIETAIPIDVKPKSSANAIDVIHSGTVPIAILSSLSFDAPTRVDATSLTFGAHGWESPVLVSQPNGKLLCSASDVNADGLPDLVCNYSLPAGFTCDSRQGMLRGRLDDGARVFGQDMVHPNPCP